MSYDCFIKTAKVRHNYEKGGPPHREMARMILQIVHFCTTQRYDLSVRCVHLLEFTTEYRFPKLVVFLLSSLKYAVKPLRSYCVVHLFVDRQEMINDHWFIIYAMHAYLAGKLVTLPHAVESYSHFFTHFNLITWRHLQRKKIVRRWNRVLGNFDSSYCVLPFKKNFI